MPVGDCSHRVLAAAENWSEMQGWVWCPTIWMHGGFLLQGAPNQQVCGISAVVPQWTSLLLSTMGLHLWGWQGAQLSCTTIEVLLQSFFMLAMGSRCFFYVCLCEAGAKCALEELWERFPSRSFSQSLPWLPALRLKGSASRKKSDRSNVKRKMKPRRGWWLKSPLQYTSRKAGKEAEMQIFSREAGPGVRRPIKAHPLNSLHLSLPICSRFSGSTAQRVHGPCVKGESNQQLRSTEKPLVERTAETPSYYGHTVTIAIGASEMLIIVK